MNQPLPARFQETYRHFQQRFATDRQFRTVVIISSVASSLVAASVVAATVAMVRQYKQPVELAQISPTPLPSVSATPQATPQLVARSLDGVLVPSGTEQQHALAVIIENHPEARPQAGLGQANVVYEAISEGGITRFMAVFADAASAVRVGPIRSARTYFVDIARELNAIFAHAGGNRDALDMIRAGAVQSMDGLGLGSPLFTRDFSRGVSQEHTLYSSTDGLWKQATATNGWSRQGETQPLLYKKTLTPGSAQSVVVSVSSAQYAVRWDYSADTNSYARSMAGTTHNDANTGTQITASTVVLQTVDRRLVRTGVNQDVWQYSLTGSGPATLLMEGKAITGTWKRSGNERTRYYDSNGKELELVPGTMWVQLIHSDTVVSY